MATIFKQPSDEGVIHSVPCTVPSAEDTGRWVLAAAVIGSGMVFIDGTVVNVALPVIQKEMNATIADAQRVVESYALFLAALILVGGSLGDRFGRRRVFAAGILIFAAASVWCGLSAEVNQLIIARAVQGIGGALLAPGSLALISASFPEDSRGRAIGAWSAFSAIFAGLGPLLGGWLAENVSWRWAFLINVPLAAVVLIILFRRVPESRDETVTGGLDWRGALFATVGLGSLVFGLIESSVLGFMNFLVPGAILFGMVSLIVFVFIEARSPSPMMPLDLFSSRTFSGANLITLLLYSALAGAMFFFPFNLIQVQDYSPSAAGLALLPFILIMFLLSRWSGGLITRYGARLPLVAGPVIAAVGFVLFALPGIGGSYWTTFFPAVAVLGIGMAVSVAPLTTTVMNAVDARHAGLASGINNAVARTAGLVSIAVFGILLLYAFNAELDDRLAILDLPPDVKHRIDEQRADLAGAEIPGGVGGETSAAIKRAISESFVAGYRSVMFVSVGLALGSALIALFMIGTEKQNAGALSVGEKVRFKSIN